MIASLTMYDRPETAAANDALWDGIRTQLGHGPTQLSRGGDVWDHWRDPKLTFAQTCGYPYRARLHDHVTLIGTPDYRLPGCPPGHYNSVFVVRACDPRRAVADYANARFAYNEPMSQSGWAAPQTHAAALGFGFENPVQSGGHLLSARMVAAGQADIASLDALSWALMQQYDDFAADLREIGRTDPTPALPYITRAGAAPDAYFAATQRAIDILEPGHRARLHLHGIVAIPAASYLAIPSPPPPDATAVSD